MSNQDVTCKIEILRKTPLVITGIFLELLRAHFRNNSEQFEYSSNELETKLVIEPAHLFKSEAVQKRPAVYVKRGAMNYGSPRAGMDDLQAYDSKLGAKEHSIFVTGSVMFFAVSSKSGEVERLAEEVSEVLLAFKPTIRQDFEFMRMDLVNIGEVGILEESAEFFTVPIALTYQFSEGWVLQYEALLLRKILVELTEKVSGEKLS